VKRFGPANTDACHFAITKLPHAGHMAFLWTRDVMHVARIIYWVSHKSHGTRWFKSLSPLKCQVTFAPPCIVQNYQRMVLKWCKLEYKRLQSNKKTYRISFLRFVSPRIIVHFKLITNQIQQFSSLLS